MSVGEVELAGTFAAALEAARPGLRLLVTSTTPAGVTLLRRRFQHPVATHPFPVDLPLPVRRLLGTPGLRLLTLLETELWPVLLREARRRRLPVLVANARLSERSVRRYLALGRLFRGPLAALSAVAARTPADAERFAAIGVAPDRIRVIGDLKLDRPDPALPEFAEEVRSLAAGRPVLVGGSLAEDEVALFLELARALGEAGLRPFLLVAPRRPDAFEAVARKLELAGVATVRRSRLGEGSSRGAVADAFLLDTIGELAGAYLLGDVALLGGTFADKGGHNVLEPLRAGLPTVVGPSTWNIRASVEAAGEAVVAVPDPRAAAAAVGRFLVDPAAREAARRAARALFAASRGAASRAAAMALALLDGEGETRGR